MASPLPYLASYKNVGTLFEKISEAKKPDSFTNKYLSDTLGLASSADRQLISLLKALGFLDSSGTPSASYDLLKNPARASTAIGIAVRRAYKPLFDANEKAHELQGEALKGLVAQITGAEKGLVGKVVGTFTALIQKANMAAEEDKSATQDGGGNNASKNDGDTKEQKGTTDTSRLRHEFHYNIQVHLPSNASEETYLRIFSALRKTFK